MASKYKDLPYIKELRNVHRGMKRRCLVKKDDSYKYYGGRRISICEGWVERCLS